MYRPFCVVDLRMFVCLGLIDMSVSVSAARAEDTQIQLAPVTISAEASAPSLSSVEGGYRVKTASLGPFGEVPVVNTPFSITIVPSDLAKNQQLLSVREAFRLIPSVQGENIRPQTRGMQAGVVQNTRIDGLNIAATTDYPIEQFDRIEVLNGLSSAIYGPSNPAGTFNFVLKRPTDVPLHELTFGYLSQTSWLGHADVGGYLDEGKHFAYRLNLLNQNGENYVNGSQLKRQLASLAFDVHITPETVVETNASFYNYVTKGLPGTFALASKVAFPAAPDPTRLGYGQPNGGDDNQTLILGGRLKHDFSQDWHLTAGILRQSNDRASTVPTNTITNNSGAYTTTAATTTYSLDTVLSNQVALNGRFFTGPVSHDFVIANNGFLWDRYTPFQTGAVTLGSASLNNPAIFPAKAFPDFKNRYRSVETLQQSITVGDIIGLTDQWAVQFAISQSWINAQNFNKTGVMTSNYNTSGVSPTASLLFKPYQNMTAYLTYAENLQQGDSAPAGVANAGNVLAPYRAKQWELGYKVDLDKINLRAALFQIQRPYAYTVNNVFGINGSQINRGIELTAAGKLTDDLTVFGGLSLLDPRLYDTGSVTTTGKQILGLSHVMFNVLLDYQVPVVPGLAFNANVNFASDRPGDYANTTFVNGYVVADLGMRYVTKIFERPVTWRLNVYNIADAHYWANVAPSGQNGYNSTDNGTGTLGAPRTVRLSMQMDF
ncbi:TonB-dependent receptor [Beijerinckia indica]|uniref:TonB-dependent siderophore receptor n=1 Tax=Beijerinckia indica subsp. indica (strain ATCC 9039 / DSM 1715 / NCIMB 8712) TaxID=395963 RepID=B2IHI8_BEII9|nr:TonB-dependent siderophore receptor [Beijerinckia indica]ACB94509.1 TonB-dependent siderophore receptor [Beijerinckia indica subsp. indica ATCC 9039]